MKLSYTRWGLGGDMGIKKRHVYQYLPASIRAFPNQEGLVALLHKAGFQHVEYRNLTGGIVAIHIAIK